MQARCVRNTVKPTYTESCSISATIPDLGIFGLFWHCSHVRVLLYSPVSESNTITSCILVYCGLLVKCVFKTFSFLMYY